MPRAAPNPYAAPRLRITESEPLDIALARIGRIAFESDHPEIPYDITLEESKRGSVVGGKWRMHPDDVAARASTPRLEGEG